MNGDFKRRHLSASSSIRIRAVLIGHPTAAMVTWTPIRRYTGIVFDCKCFSDGARLLFALISRWTVATRTTHDPDKYPCRRPGPLVPVAGYRCRRPASTLHSIGPRSSAKLTRRADAIREVACPWGIWYGCAVSPGRVPTNRHASVPRRPIRLYLHLRAGPESVRPPDLCRSLWSVRLRAGDGDTKST